MCLSCPDVGADMNDGHGDDRNLCQRHLIAAAIASGISVPKVIANLQATVAALGQDQGAPAVTQGADRTRFRSLIEPYLAPEGDSPMPDLSGLARHLAKTPVAVREREAGAAWGAMKFQELARSGQVARELYPEDEKIAAVAAVEFVRQERITKHRRHEAARVRKALRREEARALLKSLTPSREQKARSAERIKSARETAQVTVQAGDPLTKRDLEQMKALMEEHWADGPGTDYEGLIELCKVAEAMELLTPQPAVAQRSVELRVKSALAAPPGSPNAIVTKSAPMRTVVKMGSTPGECTAIVSVTAQRDSQGDVIEPGAYAKFIAAWKAGQVNAPARCVDHDWSRICGVVTDLVELAPGDARLPENLRKSGAGGLQATYKYVLTTQLGHDQWELCKAGAVAQHSVGFLIDEDGTEGKAYEYKSGVRHILRIYPLVEVSDVLLGAAAGTQTTSMAKAAAR